MTLVDLRRLQWAVRATLTLGVAASVAANILHAQPHPIARAIAAWPPLALLLTVELVSHIPVHRKGLGAVRIASTTAIAGIAAYVSYWHMVGVVARFGETGAVPYLLPLSVDGLIIVASVSLVELGSRIRAMTPPTTRAQPAHTVRPPSKSPESQPARHPEPSRVRPALAPQPLNGHAPDHLSRPIAVPATITADNPTAPHPRPEPASSHAGQPEPARETEPEPAPAREPQPTAAPQTEPQHESEPEQRPKPEPTKEPESEHKAEQEPESGPHGDDAGAAGLAPDLVPLLPAAREARDELRREGRRFSRDALASRLRRKGHTVRTTRVSELFNVVKAEAPSVNGNRPRQRA
ncbi:MAG TPA: DUF2637 domain-containing protein [Catenuloplanes sp.]|jgi:hypothetical protein